MTTNLPVRYSSPRAATVRSTRFDHAAVSTQAFVRDLANAASELSPAQKQKLSEVTATVGLAAGLVSLLAWVLGTATDSLAAEDEEMLAGLAGLAVGALSSAALFYRPDPVGVIP